MSFRAYRPLMGGLAGLILLGANASPAEADQPGWNWSAASQAERAAAGQADDSTNGASTGGRLSEAVSADEAVTAPEGDDETEAGVASAISSIMRPNDGRALANEADIEALRRRAQTGQPLRR